MNDGSWGWSGPKAAEASPGTSSGLAYYAFPTLEQLGQATEAELRADGFGYR